MVVGQVPADSCSSFSDGSPQPSKHQHQALLEPATGLHCFCLVIKLPASWWPHGLWPARLLCPWDSPGKNTGVGLPFTPPWDLPDPGIEPVSTALASGFFTTKDLDQLQKGGRMWIRLDAQICFCILLWAYYIYIAWLSFLIIAAWKKQRQHYRAIPTLQMIS